MGGAASRRGRRSTRILALSAAVLPWLLVLLAPSACSHRGATAVGAAAPIENLSPPRGPVVQRNHHHHRRYPRCHAPTTTGAFLLPSSSPRARQPETIRILRSRVSGALARQLGAHRHREALLPPLVCGSRQQRAAWLPLLAPRMAHSSSSSSGDWGPGGQTNRLAHEKSPYLLQHAHNPVDWYPWGEEAFQRARELDRPILLSSGYSTCHWCHVMAHEAFSSPRVAEILNTQFVSIKVDREERPDVDAVYMAFIQAATGGGGWPMTVFLDTKLRPFTGGTYFPEPRFITILERVSDAWQNNRGEVEAQADRVVQTFQRSLSGGSDMARMTETEAESRVRALAGEAMATAFRHLNETYDGLRGGFGRSLKFPRPAELNFLLRVHANPAAALPRAKVEGRAQEGEGEAGLGSPEEVGSRALDMVCGTLTGMAKGGIRDWVGGGFHRYSTDPTWHVPHFEKMLYDNGLLLATYTDAYKLTGDESYAAVVHEVARYLLRDMRGPEGHGFYSAEDADSPSPTQGGASKEGAFYVFTEEEVKTALTRDGCAEGEVARFCELFGVRPNGNVQAGGDPHGELRGQNVLHLRGAKLSDLLPSAAASEARVVAAKGLAALYQAREGRVRPHRDEKVLACWTGLAITGLAKAGKALRQPEYLQAAEDAAAFVKRVMYDEGTGTLRRCVFKGELSVVKGLADDYAFMCRALLDLYEATAKTAYLEWACQLQRTMDALFLARPEKGEGRGYLATSREDSNMAYPVSSHYDGAEPSATSIAVSNLLRLAALTADEGTADTEDKETFGRRAERLVAAALQAPETPYEAPELLGALSLYGPGVLQVIVAGTTGAPDTEALVQTVHDTFLPNAVLIHHDPGASPESEAILPEVARQCALVEGKATAYVCQNRVCSLPLTDPHALAARLQRKQPQPQPGEGEGESKASSSTDLGALLREFKEGGK